MDGGQMETGGEESGDGNKRGSASSGRERDNAWKAGEPRIQESFARWGRNPSFTASATSFYYGSEGVIRHEVAGCPRVALHQSQPSPWDSGKELHQILGLLWSPAISENCPDLGSPSLLTHEEWKECVYLISLIHMPFLITLVGEERNKN